MDYSNLTQQIGPRRGGGGWRPVELEVAHRRARGETWSTIAEAVGYALTTVRDYTKRDWWPQAYQFFVNQVAAERAKHVEEEALERRQQWQNRDNELKARGTQLALTTLIEAMQGRRLRDEDAFANGLAAGLSREEADAQARQSQPVGSWSERIWAAKEFLKAAGYTKASEAVAQAAVDTEKERKARELKRGTSMEINIGIHGVDYEEEP